MIGEKNLVGTVLAYVFYWLLAIALLIYMKFSEGRVKVLGFESEAYKRRHAAKADVAASNSNGKEKDGEHTPSSEEAPVIAELPR